MKLAWQRVNKNLTLIIDSKHYPLTFSTEEEAIEVESLAAIAKEGDEGAYEELLDWVDPGRNLEKLGHVVKKNGNYYLADSNIPVDELIGNKILEFQENNYPVESIIRFAKLLHLNPLPHVRRDLYRFIEENNIITTSNGYLVLYKAVYKWDDKGDELTANEEKELREFVNESVSKAKRWKKSPKNFTVYKSDDTGECIVRDDKKTQEIPENFDEVGNLKELYEKVNSEPEPATDKKKADYTDKYSRSMDISIGKPVRIRWEDCDTDPSRHCSSGLHAGSFSYIGWFKSGGDQVLCVLVNPMNITAVPAADKLRACEYLPVSILDKDEDGNFMEIEGGYWEDDYIQEEINQLQKMNHEEHKEPEGSYESKSKVIKERLDFLENN